MEKLSLRQLRLLMSLFSEEDMENQGQDKDAFDQTQSTEYEEHLYFCVVIRVKSICGEPLTQMRAGAPHF